MAKTCASVARVSVALAFCACGSGEGGPAGGAEQGVVSGSLVHLERELARARVSSAPALVRARPSWDFTRAEHGWRTLEGEGVACEQSGSGLKLVYTPVAGGMPPAGGVYSELDGIEGRWSHLEVRARTHERMAGMAAVTNPRGGRARVNPFALFSGEEGSAPLFSDGSLQTYRLPLTPPGAGEELESVGLVAASMGPATLELLSAALVPRGGEFETAHGVRTVTRGGETRTTLFAHTPATLAWRVAVPADGRLDVGLGVLDGEGVTFRATVRLGTLVVLLEQDVSDGSRWQQTSLDLARWSGEEIELELSAASPVPGAIALWGAPILSGAPEDSPAPKNIVFYVIDGGGADLMSLYGYPRATTPFLEELAKEGVVFERAHSNSTWTQSSTASFMTGLQHSVLGGLRRGMHSTPVPLAATTMAEHLRRGGWQTASFTSNPNAGRVIGLERGVDVLRDTETGHHSTSSTELHELYWSFRASYPGAPTWVHFQTTDVHEPNEPVEPFAGRFVPPEERAELARWEQRLFGEAGELFGTTSIAGFYDAALARTGIDRKRFYEARKGLYDETMAHQDRELGRFVAELKERGEWQDTLLVIAADHGHPAGTFARFGRGLAEPQPEPWQGALCDAWATRVPLVFVWPARIAGGRRYAEPVSMIDVLPTLLELAGLPPAEIAQGRSLAPYLLANEPVAHEVLLDEFRFDEARGGLVGNLEIVDGKWGASLELGSGERGRHPAPAGGRWGAVHPWFGDVPRLLLYDLERDPFALRAVNDEHPELVERYTELLLARWEAHRALAERFAEVVDTPLDADQLEQLRALGYIR